MDQVFPLADRQGSSSKAPLVSVVMPAFNVEQYIAEAIESILSQSFSDFELIIVNDGSQDGTQHMIETYAMQDKRIIVLSLQKNAGVAHARNLGIIQARGTFVAMMDADDISLPERLEAQVRFLQSQPKVGVVGGAILVLNERMVPVAERRYWIDDATIRKHLFLFMPFCFGSIMIRRNVLVRSGMFDTVYQVAEDYDLYFRLGRTMQFANLPQVVYWYRTRSHSLTHERRRDMEIATINIRKKYFKEYDASLLDRIYNVLHFLSIFCIPSKWKYKLFFTIRQKLS
ncbi:MAG: glycosyltransferase family A protein [Candidatus Peribacteraceae bacterium]|nr:glycosyltransferase family A protein [Candidatus Peribacteraceae bacterium]